MENLYYNLSEEEFSKSRKILLWIFVAAFFLGGIYVALVGPVFGLHHIKPSLSIAPFGISLVVGIIAVFATVKRKDLFFSIDNDKIEFRYGIFRPKKNTIAWIDIKDVIMPQKEKKVRLVFNSGKSFTINLTWLQRKKSGLIRKHLYQGSREKNLNIIKVIRLTD